MKLELTKYDCPPAPEWADYHGQPEPVKLPRYRGPEAAALRELIGEEIRAMRSGERQRWPESIRLGSFELMPEPFPHAWLAIYAAVGGEATAAAAAADAPTGERSIKRAAGEKRFVAGGYAFATDGGLMLACEARGLADGEYSAEYGAIEPDGRDIPAHGLALLEAGRAQEPSCVIPARELKAALRAACRAADVCDFQASGIQAGKAWIALPAEGSALWHGNPDLLRRGLSGCPVSAQVLIRWPVEPSGPLYMAWMEHGEKIEMLAMGVA
jgi:hypothetical protein